MFVLLAGTDIGLVDVIRPNSIKSRYIARHAGHEARQQRRQSQAQYARGKVVQQHVRYRQVVVQDRSAFVVQEWLAGREIDLWWNQPVPNLRICNRHRIGVWY